MIHKNSWFLILVLIEDVYIRKKNHLLVKIKVGRSRDSAFVLVIKLNRIQLKGIEFLSCIQFGMELNERRDELPCLVIGIISPKGKGKRRRGGEMTMEKNCQLIQLDKTTK